jgi:glycosyltransferase involved in cell wall biosynthesis
MKNKQPLLSICIPTYNRANHIKELLQDIIPHLDGKDVKLVISDNSENDETLKIVEHYSDNNKIIYYKQPENVGFDINVLKTFELCKSDYYWTLGDSNYINWEEFDNVLNDLFSNKYDLYVLNRGNDINLPDKEYYSCKELLVELGWHITNMPSLIFSEALILSADPKRFIGTNFMHWGMIFETLSLQKSIHVKWRQKQIITRFSRNKESWSWYPDKIWALFAKDWSELVLSLPACIDLETKTECIRKHAYYTKFLLPKNALALNAINKFSYEDYKTYKRYLPYISSYSTIVYFFISLVPSFINLVKIKRFFFRKNGHEI